MDEDKLQLELKRMQDEIISAVEAMITKSIGEIEKYFNDVLKEKFIRIDETLDRYQEHHKDHFTAEKALENKITESRESIMKDVETKININNNSSKNNIGIFISAIAVITSIILSIVLNM